jgi:hypothetical protein
VLKALLVLLLAGLPLCKIPVFRYALERWRSTPYPATLTHRGTLDAEARSLLRELEASGLNVEVEIREGGADAPTFELRYPGSERVAWSGPFTRAALKPLIDSPGRAETVRRLTSGHSSVVWWLLESGDAAKDRAAAELLERELKRLEKTLQIATPGPGDPPLRSALPLKLSFSILRVPPDAGADAAFVETLARARTDWALPAVVPVFGRGRALGSLCVEEINEALVARMAEALADDCSCEIKELNPGIDLLFAADWEGLLDVPPPDPEKPVEALPLLFPKPPPHPPTAPSPAPARRPPAWGFAAALAVAAAAGWIALRKGTR